MADQWGTLINMHSNRWGFAINKMSKRKPVGDQYPINIGKTTERRSKAKGKGEEEILAFTVSL